MCSPKTPFTFKDVCDLDFYFTTPHRKLNDDNSNVYYLEKEIPKNGGSLDDLIRKPTLKEDYNKKLRSSSLLLSSVFNEYIGKYDIVNRIPVIDQLFINASETIKPFTVLGGVCNEIEYSGNIIFIGANVKLPKEDSRPGYIIMKIRTYFKKNLTLYTNDAENILSTRYDYDRSITNNMYVDFFLRIDENIPYGEDTHQTIYGPLNADKTCTAKIKVVRKRFNYNNATYTLMGAIETELNDLITLPIYGPKSVCHVPFKRLKIIYWYLRGKYVDGFTGCSRNLVFRIAFRFTLIAKSGDDNADDDDDTVTVTDGKVQCNVECEDLILGYQFVECHNALMKFYRYQYKIQHGNITPLFEQASYNLKEIANELTVHQLNFLNSLEHIRADYKEEEEEEEDATENGNEQISSQLVEFMRMSAIRLYLEQIPDKQIALAYANPLNDNLIHRYNNEMDKYQNNQINDFVDFEYYNNDDVFDDNVFE